MVAEYQPATGKYYYYTTDQVNSTRVVTDDMGNVVYSAAHDPYGGVQQTWVNTFNPGWKFSGKEQDPESSLYYFGARYYDPALYRFLSPDPVIPTDRALYNPQRWNLYGYCLGNPISYLDENGFLAIRVHWRIVEAEADTLLGCTEEGNPKLMKPYAFTTIHKSDISIDISTAGDIPINVTFTTYILPPGSGWWATYEAWLGRYTYESVLEHEFMHIIDTILCVESELKQIEAEVRSKKITADEAMERIIGAFNKAMKSSSKVRDNWVVEYGYMVMRWMKDLYPDYGTNLFLQWLFAPQVVSLINIAFVN